MINLDKIFESRRDTRHFTNKKVPQHVLDKAIQAGHYAPSVGLTDATRYYIIDSDQIKKQIKDLFISANQKASSTITNTTEKQKYQSLKLEAIQDAPIGLVIAYDRSVLNNFTIGTVGSNESIKFSAVCAAQNIWLSLTDQGYSMGWVSIINYYDFKKLLNLPDHIEPLGYFCIGEPATNYDQQPMLQQLDWKQKAKQPIVQHITQTNTQTIAQITNSKKKPAQPFNHTALTECINQKTKPKGSLGKLESIAFQIGKIFKTITPKLQYPHIIVFAADHGIANHDISAYPQEVTRYMVQNFLAGGAAINVFCNQNKIELIIVDAGVNYDFATNLKLISKKVAKGTQSFYNGPAMSLQELELCFIFGTQVMQEVLKTGTNCVGFGEMGIGNTATASVLMSVLCNLPIELCTGKGTGINDEKLKIKIKILEQAINNAPKNQTLQETLAYFGGFEILQMAAAMQEAYRNNCLLLIDGFIASIAFLIAYKQEPEIKQNAIFCHKSNEQAHQKLLDYLQVQPLLDLDLRLGEGTGCAIAYPIIDSAVQFLNQMSSFESAGIAQKM